MPWISSFTQKGNPLGATINAKLDDGLVRAISENNKQSLPRTRLDLNSSFEHVLT